ncbi:MAG: hypothetical protein L3J11_09060 [Draconibacterium sp.]|nr:hypothetical protein [Draconibacterium sp.]
MEIRELKIGDLISFIESTTYKKLNPKPITELRAISQFNNPDADPRQIALIYVADGTDLLGFAGLLPRKINNTNISVFSNTCWWVHPEKGRGLALPLILRAIEKSNSSLYLAESTPHLKAILEKTDKFQFSEEIHGVRGFIRFYLTDIFSRRYKNWVLLSFLIICLDKILNVITGPIRAFYLNKFEKNSFTIECVQIIDRGLENFINHHATNDFIQKTSASFTWFQKFPWVQVSEKQPPYEYPFSHVVKNFELQYYCVKKEGVLKGFVAISYRDNLAKIPYIYFNKEDISEITQIVMATILKNKYNSVIVFHPEIVEYLNKNKMPFLFRKLETKIVGTTKSVYQFFKQKPFIQDGDGDVIFT